MNVMFIYPNQDGIGYIPVGISLLSSILKNNGHNTSLFDTTFYSSNGDDDNDNLQFKRTDSKLPTKRCVDIYKLLKDKIEKFKPDLIAGTCTSNDYEFLCDILKFIKNNYDIPVIVGGPHTTVVPDEVISETFIDIICIGEGESALLELCNRMELNRNIYNISNLWIKFKNKIYKNDIGPLVKDMDTLPYPDWDIFNDENHYRPFDGKIYYFGWFEFGRGCPFSCTYCINPHLHKIYKGKGNYYRSKSPKRMMDELLHFKKKYNIKFVRFVDETFLAMPISKIKEFAELYNKHIRLPFIISSRPETINDESVNILKSMITCKHISMGIESGNETLRRNVLNRQLSNDTIYKAFKLLQKNGIKTTAFNIIGFPTETRDMIFDTIKINKQIQPDVIVVSLFYPYKGTPLRDVCINEGYIDSDKVVNYTSDTILNMPQISRESLIGLKRAFILYARLPRLLYPLIVLSERISCMYFIMSNIYKYKYGI